MITRLVTGQKEKRQRKDRILKENSVSKKLSAIPVEILEARFWFPNFSVIEKPATSLEVVEKKKVKKAAAKELSKGYFWV